jgi:cytochrome b6-f complex subunit 4
MGKLAKGMGHNGYGEPAWPNDILYVFPICILALFLSVIGWSVLLPAGVELGQRADSLVTPVDIRPEWYLLPSYNLIRIVPDKSLGILAASGILGSLLLQPFIESVNCFQNLVRRPAVTVLYLYGWFASMWLTVGSSFEDPDSSFLLGMCGGEQIEGRWSLLSGYRSYGY